MQSEQRRSTSTSSDASCTSQRSGCRKGDAQLGHVVSLATAATVPPRPDGTVGYGRFTRIVMCISVWSVQTIR
jgi:hypothetical protein